MSRIKHPNPQQGTFTDRIGGVVFHDGYAEVDLTEDPNLRDAYLMHGYEISVFTGITVDLETLATSSIQVDLPVELDGTPGALPLAVEGDNSEQVAEGTRFFDLTVPQLRDLAEAEGIDIPKGAKRADIVRAFLDAAMTES